MKYLTDELDSRNITYVCNEPMSAHTTFKIGGAADILITIKSVDELHSAVNACKASGIPVMILGNGSNLLVSDNGIEGAVITLDGDFKEITVDGTIINSGAGAKLSRLCGVALENSLTGLEFAYGIPGSVGGAVFMNAGAYGGEIKDVVFSVTHIDRDGKIGTIKGADLDFGYRHSVYKENGFTIIGATFRLKLDNRTEIRNRMDDFMGRRKDKQPLEFPSAGSVFRRPEGAFAGALIEQCGLKGKSVGGAQVSPKHAGFIVNIGGATAEDVKNLVELIQSTVKKETGYDLQREIIFLNKN